jgi:hypothetical protein
MVMAFMIKRIKRSRGEKQIEDLLKGMKYKT